MSNELDNSSVNETDLQSAVEIVAGGMKNVILDATVLTTLMACPRLADFRFNHNLQSINGKSNSLECGSLVHVFLEYFYKSIIGGVKREQATGFAFAAAELYVKGCPTCTDFVATDELKKPACRHKPNEFPGMQNTPKESEGYKTGWHYVLDTCQQYVDHWRSDHWVPLEVETVKQKILYQDEEIRILWKAKLDWVVDTNQGIYSVDHKTMKQRRNTNSMNNQFMGQCLIMDTRNVFLNKIGFQTSLKPEEKFTRPPVSYSAERLFEWQSETLPYYAKLLLMYAETGHFPPNFTHCEGKYGDCAFYENVCSGNPSMREENIKLFFKVGPTWNPTNDEDE
jgi:hypothetical protein